MPALDGALRLIDSRLVPEALSALTTSVPTRVSPAAIVAFVER